MLVGFCKVEQGQTAARPMLYPYAIISATRNPARVVELVDAADSKNLFTLEKQAAARGYARVKKVSFVT